MYYQYMKIINDCLHHDIRMSDVAIQIIDTPLYERQNSIKQTSMAYRVWPSATHTRKNHQIGTYGLTANTQNSLIARNHLIVDKDLKHPQSVKEMTESLLRGEMPRITKDEFEWICLGGLVHDLGHGPASHSFDDLLEELVESGELSEDHPWLTHEQRSQIFFKYLVDKYKIPLSETAVEYICQIIEPDNENSHDFRFQFINNKINGVDLDKIDYIARDNYVFGLSATIDINRMLSNCSISVDTQSDMTSNKSDNESNITTKGTYWSFNERIRNDLFNLFMVRFRLYKEIYNHPKVVKFELAYGDVLLDQKTLILKAINEEDIDLFSSFTDESILWKASETARSNFLRRDRYCLVNKDRRSMSYEEMNTENKNKEYDELDEKRIHDIREIYRTVGFFGKQGLNPFDFIRFYNRKTGDIVKLKPEDINLFLTFDCTCETMIYHYQKNC